MAVSSSAKSSEGFRSPVPAQTGHVGDGKAVCSRIGLRDLLQQIFPAADQPHGISLRRKALRKAAADAGSGTDDNSSFHMRKDRTRKTENT